MCLPGVATPLIEGFFPNPAVPVYSSLIVSLSDVGLYTKTSVEFLVSRNLCLETASRNTSSGLHPSTMFIIQGPTEHCQGFCENLWNKQTNILKYREKFEMSLHVSLKFLSFSWRYWGNIQAYGVLVCFCVRQFVFQVISSLASFHRQGLFGCGQLYQGSK